MLQSGCGALRRPHRRHPGRPEARAAGPFRQRVHCRSAAAHLLVRPPATSSLNPKVPSLPHAVSNRPCRRPGVLQHVLQLMVQGWCSLAPALSVMPSMTGVDEEDIC